MTESTIMELLHRRDPEALTELQREYHRYCTAIAGGILADRADVEEVVADVWMQVWSSIPPNRPEHLRLYVGRIARNLALNRLEYRNAGKRAALPMEELESFCMRNDVSIGIIAVPADCAQDVCDILVACGVEAIWNFAPVQLRTPERVIVKNENLALSLTALRLQLKRQEKQA